MKNYILALALLLSSGIQADKQATLAFTTILEEAPIENILDTWIPLFCHTSLTDLPAKTHAAVTGKTFLNTSITSVITLWLAGKYTGNSPFELSNWLDKYTHEITTGGMVKTSFVGLLGIRNVIHYYNFARPEYVAQQIDTTLLKSLNEHPVELEHKIMGGTIAERLKIIPKLIVINPFIKTIIEQLTTIEKYKKNRNIHIIVRRLQEQSDYLDSLQTLVKSAIETKVETKMKHLTN
jgi:hypothetical protein